MSVESLKTTFESEPGYLKACELLSLLEQGGYEAYIVGGAVRDALLGRALHDFDLCTSATPSEMKKLFKNFKILTHGEDFGTLTVVCDEQPYEVTTYRGESSYSDSRHPDQVKFLKSLKEDLKRRDFTINALAFHPDKGVMDFVEGLADIKSRKLRTVGDPKERFLEDALRVARLFRFSLSLGFEIETETLKAAKASVKSLLPVSKERIFNEIEKSLKGRPFLENLNLYLNKKIDFSFLKTHDLNLLDKAYVVLLVCDRLGVDFKDYILNKKMKGASSWLFSMTKYSGTELESLFIKCVEHYELFGVDQESLWRSVCILNDKATAHSELRSFKKGELDLDLSVLKQNFTGAELGKKILELKRNRLFK